MKRTIITLTLIAAFGLFSTAALSAVPQTFNYSGQLTEADLPVDGSADMVFALYANATGGAALWSETEDALPVDNGMFTVELGDNTPIADLMDGATYWLQVTVDGTAMLPRTPFLSVPYALRAGDADTLAGLTPTQIADNGANSVQSDLDALTARIAALETLTTNQQTALEAAEAAIADNDADILDLQVAVGAIEAAYVSTTELATELANYAALTVTDALNTRVAAIETSYVTAASLATTLANYATLTVTNALDTRIDAFDTLLAGVTRNATNIYFTGMNVHVRSGSGSTDGAINGEGNLIVGYNEARTTGSVKTGSHNIVVGRQHNYSSYGGLVVGYENAITGSWSSVSAGSGNTASGDRSSVSGGNSNTASVPASSVSGGSNNTASGVFSSVSGGNYNTAPGDYSSVGGGRSNTASGIYSSVNGGSENIASGARSSVSGGNTHESTGQYDWRAGTLFQDL